MPKITGPTIAQHVANQEAAVFAAAIGLFARDGVADVAMSDIADEVGLARSSLYRYFPNKAAIVARWFDLVMAPLIADSDRIARSEQARPERFAAWINRQLALLSDPANRTMIDAALVTTELTEEQRTRMGARHQDLYASLHAIIADPDAASGDDLVRARVLLIVGLLRQVGDLEALGVPVRKAHSELLRAAALIAEIHV